MKRRRSRRRSWRVEGRQRRSMRKRKSRRRSWRLEGRQIEEEKGGLGGEGGVEGGVGG
jgi:hypothetical protein